MIKKRLDANVNPKIVAFMSQQNVPASEPVVPKQLTAEEKQIETAFK